MTQKKTNQPKQPKPQENERIGTFEELLALDPKTVKEIRVLTPEKKSSRKPQ
jgi:hypothetical protein